MGSGVIANPRNTRWHITSERDACPSGRLATAQDGSVSHGEAITVAEPTPTPEHHAASDGVQAIPPRRERLAQPQNG